jgi:hypothetical protein
MSKEVHILFTSGVETAAVNFEDNRIYISSQYLNGVFSGERRNSEFSIAALCGIVVHETAHLAYSRKDLSPYISYIRKNTKLPFVESLAGSVGNMVEDVFIEAEIDRSCPNFYWMLEYSQEAVFSDSLKQASWFEAKGVSAPPDKLEGVVKVFNVLIQHRCEQAFHCNPYIDGLFNLMMTAEGCSTFEQRDALALSIYEGLMERVSQEEASQQSGQQESATAKISVQATGDEIEANSSKAKKIEDGLNDSINPMMKEIESQIFTMDRDKEGTEDSRAIVVIEKKAGQDFSALVQIDNRYLEIGRVGRQRATINRPYGRDDTKGTHIRRLYRIATDERIFAEQVDTRSYKPMQVLILCDLSGSMIYARRLVPALSATMGAAVALSQSRCQVAVYGHNADHPRSYAVNITKMKDFNEPCDSLQSRMSWVVQSLVPAENRDGNALKYLSKKLTDTQRKRLLIVISDGYPNASAGGYRGKVANTHTKNVVDGIRKKGIDVVSISIAEEAMEVNNFIYGKESNLCNTDPNAILQIVNRLVMR